MTMPAWLAIERSVIALCSRSTLTSVGGIARAAGHPSAIATPAPTASARYGHTSVVPDELTSARPTPMHAASSSEPAKIRRRGARSASCPGGQRQHEQRHELGQPDPAQIERAAVQRVDLPADHHLEHLEADAHPEQGQPPQSEIALLERRPDRLKASPRPRSSDSA